MSDRGRSGRQGGQFGVKGGNTGPRGCEIGSHIDQRCRPKDRWKFLWRNNLDGKFSTPRCQERHYRTETLARKLAKRVQSLRRAATNSARKIAKTGWKVRKKVARLVRRLQRSLKGPNGLPKCLTPKGECTIRKRRFLMETASNVGCLTSSRGVPRGSSKGPRRVPKGSGTGSCWLLLVRSGSRALSANLFGR